ncbi:MAG: hypothetical protein ACREFP_05830 [Acetobacteraceae bacterium]
MVGRAPCCRAQDSTATNLGGACAGEAGANHTWSDSELHASMVRHFSLYRNEPQWLMWQVVCQLHDLGPGLYRIMLDQSGQRDSRR